MKNHFPTSLSIISIKSTISFVVLLLVSFSINAQNHEKKLSKADQIFKSYAYVDARAIYLDVAQKGYSSPSLYSKLADSFYFTGNLEDSVEWYEKLIQSYPEDLNPEYLFKYAQSLKSVERYKEADMIMEQFYTITKNDKRANFFAKKRDYLDFIKMQSDKFELYPLNINSKNSEYSPSFNYQNQIVFASSREKNNTFKLHEWDEMPFLDLFASNIQEDNITLDDPIKLKGKINTKFHESSTSFSKDGKTVYFSRNNYLNHKLGKSKKGVVLLKLYKATLQNDSWENITELPFCSDNYSVSHPSLSLDGKKLYFASDMPGTLGQSDLFVVDILGDNTYGKPKNLGNKINTEGRETFPYVSNNGTLYFSSDGHIGLGGLDVFVSVPDEYGFSDSYNVGRPINSPKDDFTFILNEETKIGYFASNRKGGKGNDDIYSFKQTEELITSCMQYIEGVITNEATGNPLTSADIVLLNKDEKVIREIISDANGNYRFKVACNENYTIKVKSKNFVPRDILAETTDAFEFINEIDISLINKEKLLPTTIEINIGDDLTKTLQLEPIYFGLNDAIITTETEVELQKIISIMNKYPDLKIEVRSHTDSRSSYWYNKKLSVQRMRATVQYITEKGGINWRRVRGKAYGERRLLNKCTDDVPCTEEEHQQNRRSEFIVRK